MNLLALREKPPQALAMELEVFERRFTYPLGSDRSFRVSHGEDYTRFFRSIGPATCFVAEQSDRVIGALGVAIRQLSKPDGSICRTAYIGDLKVHPDARSILALLRLSQAADAWARPQVTAAYGVVMDGTGTSPTDYTGRAGIQPFQRAGKVMILRIPTQSHPVEETFAADPAPATRCFQALSQGRYVPFGGQATDRSEMIPRWFVHSTGVACGRLEDTRSAKRLISNDGIEIDSAHLACFAFSDPVAGACLVKSVCGYAGLLGIPALFVSVAETDFESLNDAMGPIDKVLAPATVYCAGLIPGPAWTINSSEI